LAARPSRATSGSSSRICGCASSRPRGPTKRRKAPAYTPPPPAPIYNWTGFYVGGNVGYSWGKASGDITDPGLADFTDEIVSLPTSFSNSLKPKGAIAGGQIGYNWQLNPTWVVGLEGDIQWSGEKASRNRSASSTGSAGPECILLSDTLQCATFTESASVNTALEAKLQWFSTIRARAGVLITPTLLLYGTGGFAFGEVKVSGSGAANDVLNCSGGLCVLASFPIISSGAFAFSQSKTKTGWTAGAGVEGALAGNWTWKVEYLYLDLGSENGSVADNFGGTVSWNTKFTDNIVRAGLNYRFGGPY
jgi:outer membrane immunogenic protein